MKNMRNLLILLFVLTAGVESHAAPIPAGTIFEIFAIKSGAGGIKFKKMSLTKAMALAKSSGKIIFIDAYTTWCGPCKEMAKTTFQSPRVGSVFNEKFINIKIDVENDEDGEMLEKNYNVAAYPTLLFIDANGKLVKRLVGKQSEEKLLNQVNMM